MNNKSYQMESISSINFFFLKEGKGKREQNQKGLQENREKKNNKSYWMEIISSFKIKEKGKK